MIRNYVFSWDVSGTCTSAYPESSLSWELLGTAYLYLGVV